MYYGAIKNCDIANGPGTRVSIFVSGCNNHCPGCFQPETWDFEYGKPFTDDTIKEIIEMMKPDYITGLSVLGGEPLDTKNLYGVASLLLEVYEEFGGKKNVWIYTGYTFEELMTYRSKDYNKIAFILRLASVLVDGRFDESKKDLTLRFRGSSNQRLIDLNKYHQMLDDYLDGKADFKSDIYIWSDDWDKLDC